ncbi:hypothetical protein AN963_27385 [Brevibacillus choshinensis]|uniref:Uncharacterized protein n=1 Tax=Brevibacillus choshinensis TaxID=54911 RepID=A0ABR5N3L5_BRECH|nr:hypothetical protein [Brevibacillus choshinensis]KQL45041.1 hypothetical protein AN963_27385 [Brevibacillus choshinensis]
MEKKISIVLGFLTGVFLVNWNFDISFLDDLGINAYYIIIAIRWIGFLGALLCALTLLFDALKAIRSS